MHHRLYSFDPHSIIFRSDYVLCEIIKIWALTGSADATEPQRVGSTGDECRWGRI